MLVVSRLVVVILVMMIFPAHRSGSADVLRVCTAWRQHAAMRFGKTCGCHHAWLWTLLSGLLGGNASLELTCRLLSGRLLQFIRIVFIDTIYLIK